MSAAAAAAAALLITPNNNPLGVYTNGNTIIASSYLSPPHYSKPNPNFTSLSVSHSFNNNNPKPKPSPLSSRRTTWLYGHMNRDQDPDYQLENGLGSYGSDEELGGTLILPTQSQTLNNGSEAVKVSDYEYKPSPDVDYLQELLAIQQQGPRAIGFFGTRNMGFMHQELIEILSYAMVITKNHIYTSGASGTNAAVIRGALRAEKPELLTVILPQSLSKQPPESQELLSKVKNVIEKPHNDHLPLIEASRLCNMDIISHVQQVICFAFHDSRLLMETCQEAKNFRKIVTLFYLD
ncbi:uncharacterized protein LOC123910791 [Trifolium pratense]|uniref:uncharacterized protein LOC123910791 n=1 Tax=Trifolium pratense TaxID=57577 RepID=UPI001E6974C1|nr:uncharacterized protein LOC123910791 [Trifolium pratense]